MRTLVVLPTYDEAANIADVLTRLRAAVPDVDILVVDDNSPDGTADLAKATAEELGQIDVEVRAHKDGLGNAYRHGFRIGMDRGYEILLQMDADLSHDPTAVPELLGAIDGGADAVIGSRYVPGGSIPHWPWHRRQMSRWGNWYACAVLGMSVSDTTSGFRGYRIEVLEEIDIFSTRAKGYGFQIETAYRISRSGKKLAEVPISFTDRVRGYSKMSLAVAVEELLLVTWWGFRDRVLRRGRRRR